MDDKSLEMLEFPRIREILAGFTAFSASRELALSLRPTADTDAVLLRLGRSAEARRLLSLEPDLSIGDARDVREPVRLAGRDKTLEPEALVDIRSTLASARRMRSAIGKLAPDLPLLWSIAEGIPELRQLEERIGKCFTPKGELLDAASDRLADLRYRLRETRQQLVERLEAIIRSDGGRRFIQDAFIDERDGRYVIPVKVEQQREVKGIVHDVSNSGATVFIEPWSTVELGNELRQLTIEEKREVDRILGALSRDVGANEEAICDSVELLAELDLALAKARYAIRVEACEPQVLTGGEEDRRVIRLVDARHPLLKGKAVPLSVEIGEGCSVLVITGPNTGGKTVALKTIGLLTLMAQAGVPIPASEDSCLPVFDGVYVDIGDEQSIERTLSTFSWHMGNIVRIIRDSTERSLVLLDEMGTSTDPNEGAALARAILLHFLSRGTMVVATTHYSELKVFAHSTPGLQNASLDFDPVTLAPTYHLTVGVPGGSNAMAIASQLGLSREIIDAAREMLPKGTQDIEALLATLMDEKRRAEDLRRGLEKEEERARRVRIDLETEVRSLQEGKREAIRETRDRVTSDAAVLQSAIREAETELKKQLSKERVEKARRALSHVREQLRGEAWQAEAEGVGGDGVVADVRLAVGDQVWLTEIEAWATVLSLPDADGQLDVRIGQTRMRLAVDDIGDARPAGEGVRRERLVTTGRLSRPHVSHELDLRGKRADDVEPELDGYLDSASLAHLGRVRIIHGYGTGTVRQIVRTMLATHPLVKSYRPGGQGEGGDGVTVVEL